MKKLSESIICLIYIFIIFSAMFPNKNNSININNLEAVIPGINSLYSEEESNYQERKYSFKFIEIFKKYCDL